MMSITVIHPPADAGWADQRLRDVLRFALAGQEFRTVSTAGELDNLAGQKLLFALPLGDAGVNLEYVRILTRLRREPGLLEGCTGTVTVHNHSSARMAEGDGSIDFAFTDPPFGDFIPYAEVNQINELWLDRVTDRTGEVIISASQHKDLTTYQQMLTQVFGEVYRVLKPQRCACVVFHAAKAAVWRAFKGAVDGAGFHIAQTNILDKTQSSFKQTVSEGSVQGDPLFLLQKGGEAPQRPVSDQAVLRRLMEENAENPAFDRRRCYSTYVYTCLELGAAIQRDTDAWLNRREYRQQSKPGCQKRGDPETADRRAREDMDRLRRLLEQETAKGEA